MARTSRNGAPAASFDALDNIDIDDMFADGGDDLFDGLADDLGLDQMGDITNNMGTNNNEEETAAAATTEEKPAPAPAVEEPPKRRKTKRKPKSPVLLDEEEDEAPKKKRRSTKTGTTKKKNSKKDKDEAKADPPKLKSKIKGMGVPTPLQRHASSSSGPSTPSSGNVAAAGIFGGRQKRGLPLSRANSDKQKTKNKASLKTSAAAPSASLETIAASTSSNEKTKLKKSAPSVTTSGATEPPAPKKPAPFAPPIPQTTFCGLKPSNTLFYPFMPSLPAEPSIKNRKQYPAIDRIHSSFMAFINNASNAPKGSNGGSPASEAENIHRLMLETLKDINPSGAQSNATTGQDDKKTNISNAVGSLRQTMVTIDKPKLATDLFSACALLKRQYDFLQQNLTNMQRWCKANFTEAEYAMTYGSPLDAQKKQKETADTDSILSKFKKPLIKVKIRCSGFKEPKLSGTLFAYLPSSAVPTAASGEHKEKKTTKKRKSSSVDPSLLPTIQPAEKEVVIKTYPELRPAKRRQVIMEHVAHTAKELEAACISRTASFCQAIDRRHNELKKMVDEDEVLPIHTSAMWQYIEKAGYFSEITEEALNDTLRSVWAPEAHHDVARDIPFADNSLTDRIRTEQESKGLKRQSVFNGLQSLLVDESSDIKDDELSDIDDDDDSEEEDDRLLHDNVDEPLRPLVATIPAGLQLADLSALALDERADLHLRRAGMLENHPTPCPDEASNGPASNSSRGGKDGLGDGAADGQSAGGETLEKVIERMSDHLMELNKVNNARASFLESAARTYISVNGKLKSDEEAAMIAKCQQVLKKNKESKVKSSKPKTATKDEYALPW